MEIKDSIEPREGLGGLQMYWHKFKCSVHFEFEAFIHGSNSAVQFLLHTHRHRDMDLQQEQQ